MKVTTGIITPIHKSIELRDYFAAMAMQGLLADSRTDMYNDEYAEAAYAVADSMLAERSK